ncbi:MAG: hypothetical protein WC783_00895 [Candidatus Paceibacterota bacterium]|jgi:hypothetical protein
MKKEEKVKEDSLMMDPPEEETTDEIESKSLNDVFEEAKNIIDKEDSFCKQCGEECPENKPVSKESIEAEEKAEEEEKEITEKQSRDLALKFFNDIKDTFKLTHDLKEIDIYFRVCNTLNDTILKQFNDQIDGLFEVQEYEDGIAQYKKYNKPSDPVLHAMMMDAMKVKITPEFERKHLESLPTKQVRVNGLLTKTVRREVRDRFHNRTEDNKLVPLVKLNIMDRFRILVVRVFVFMGKLKDFIKKEF